MELFDTKYFRGQGPVFLGDRNATTGAPEGLVFIGDISSCELTPNVTNEEIIENVTGSGGVGSSFTRAVEYQMTMQMRSIKPAHLAIALQGTATTKAAASVTDEAHTVRLDKFSRLQHNKVSAVVVTGTGGTPTYVANTDYKVHADEGLIEWLTGGTVTDGLAVLIDYSYAAQKHVAANPQNLEKYLVFAGKNSADNSKMTRCEIYRIKLDPSALGLIQDAHAEMPITGRVLIDKLRAAGDQFFSWKIQD